MSFKILSFILLISFSLLKENPNLFETYEFSYLLDKERIQNIVTKVNNLNTTWKASLPSKNYTPLLGADLELLKTIKKTPKNSNYFRSAKNFNLPESYDAREAHPECKEIIDTIYDQANCGSCWAVSSTSVMSDRICIKSNGKIQKHVSTLNLISCLSRCYGCNGGLSFFAFDYWVSDGLVTGGDYGDENSCQPYFLPPCDHHTSEETYGQCGNVTNTPRCSNVCQENYEKSYDEDKTYGNDSYYLYHPSDEEVMNEIYENGPVVSSFNVYEDFYAYKSGIYQNVAGAYMGSHEIRILGWGVENGVKYWLCANSWNKYWGENGYFRILRGENECEIEAMITAASPVI